MELKNGPVFPLRIIFGGLQAANQAFGSVLSAGLMLVIFIGILIAASFLSGFISPVLPLFLMPLLYFVALFLCLLFCVAMIQIIAAKVEKTGMTAVESLTSSVIPSAYFLVSFLILTIPCGLLSFGAILSASPLVVFITQIFLYFVMLPFIFVPHALVLRQQGPISALKYSWEMGTRYYFRTLITLITFSLLFIFVILGIFCAVKAVKPQWVTSFLTFVQQPEEMRRMYIASQLMLLPKPLVFTFSAILFGVELFMIVAVMAVCTILFLNLDYSIRGGYNRDTDNGLPMPSLPVTPLPQNPVYTSTVPAEPAKDEAPVVKVEEVSVKQSSIRTDSVDENTLHHLEQVYSAQEHLDRAVEQEEDRMPTILFDEDMLKQLAESEKQMRLRQEKAEKKEEEDGQSIKMSDKPLL